MAGANLQVVIQAQDQASKVLAGISSSVDGLGKGLGHLGGISLSGIVGSLGALGLAGFGVNAIGSAISGFVSDAIDSEKVATALNAVLASTHGVSGMTADSVNALATSLSRMTPFEDEAIISAENMLLTFTSIGKDVFPAATETVLNMSQALGQDLQSSAIQLGKALNDPLNGITALSRVGVSFTDAQKKSIEQMVKAGNVMGAQKVILKELSTEFGGAAKAAGETFAGRLTILNTQIGNMKEAIGGPLISVLSGLLSAVTPIITSFTDGLPDAIGATMHALQGVQAAIMDLVTGQGIDQAFADFNDLFVEAFNISPGEVLANLQGLGMTVVNWVLAEVPILTSTILRWAQAWIDWVIPAEANLLGQLVGLGGQMIDWIVAQVPVIESAIVAWAQGWTDWVSVLIPQFLGEFNRLATEWVAWIRAEVPIIRSAIVAWAQGWVGWITELIPRFLAEFHRLGVEWIAWIKAEVPIIQAAIVTWAQGWVSWITALIPKFLAEFNRLGTEWVAWINTEAVIIGAQLKTWTQALSDWVAPAIPQAMAALGQFQANVLTWIDTQSAPLLAGFSSWATAFAAWVPGAATTFLAEWPGVLNRFLDWIEVAAGPILVKLGDWATAFVAWIGPKIPDILLAMGAISLAMFTFIAETALTITSRLIRWGLAFVEWVVPQIPTLLGELAKLNQAVYQWILDQAVQLAPRMFDLGVQMIRNLISGLGSISLPSIIGGGPASGRAAPPPMSGSTSTYGSLSGMTVHNHIYGNNADPSSVQSGANAGTLAAARSMGLQ